MKKLYIIASSLLVSSLASNALNALQVKLSLAGLGCTTAAGYIGYETLKNYYTLQPLHEKVQSEHALLGDEPKLNSKLYRWKRDMWPTARFMQADRENVKRAFTAAFVNRELFVYNAQDVLLLQPTWLDIKDAIIREKEELRADMLFLENNYLTRTPLLSFMNSRGFVYDYKAICKTVGTDPYATMAWTKEQEEQIEALVKKTYSEKSSITIGLPNLIVLNGYNYSLAASIYWRLFKFYKRLEMLEGIVGELAAGYDAVYVRPQENILNVTVK